MANLDDVVEQLTKLVGVTVQSNEEIKSSLRDLVMQRAATNSLSGNEMIPDISYTSPEFGLGSAQGRKQHNEERMRNAPALDPEVEAATRKRIEAAINSQGIAADDPRRAEIMREALNREQAKKQDELAALASQAEFLAAHPKAGFLAKSQIGRAGIEAFEELRTGRKEVAGAIAQFGQSALSTLPGKVMLGGFLAGRGLPNAYDRIEGRMGRVAGGFRQYGMESGALSPTGFGAAKDILANKWLAYPQFMMQDLLGGGASSLFGVSDAATAGAQSSYRAFKRGLNPFDALSIEQAQGINQAVLQRGYKGEVGVKMEEASSDIVKRLGIDAGQAVSFLDLAVRRFRMDIKDAKEEIQDFGILSKSAMKGLNEYMKEVQETASLAAGQGLRNGASAIGLGKTLASVPQLSADTLTKIMTSQPMQGLTMADMTMNPAIRNNPTLMGQLSTGNIFGVNQDPYQAVISSTNSLDKLVDSFMAGKPNTAQNRDMAFMMVSRVTGASPEEIRIMYNNRNKLKSEARSGQAIDALSKQFEGFNKKQFKEGMQSSWEGVSAGILQERGKFENINKINFGGNIKKSANTSDLEKQLGIDFKAFLGSNYSDDRKHKILQALIAGDGATDDPIANEALQELKKSLSSREEYTNLMTYYGNDPDKLADMSKGSWKEFIKANPDKLGGIRKNLEQVLKSAGESDPQYKRNASNRQLINDVLEGRKTISEFQEQVQNDVNKARARAEGREVLISLTDDAARLIKILGPDHSRAASSKGSGFDNRNDNSIIMGQGIESIQKMLGR